MTSQKKLAANRLNAQKSTGPKSARGKAHSRYNALKTGVHAVHRPLPGEDHEAYRRLSRRLLKRYAPAEPVEELIVDQILGHIWRVQRLEKAERAYLQAVDETRCNRQAQFAFTERYFNPQDELAGKAHLKPGLLGDSDYGPIQLHTEGHMIDDLSGTFLEAAISRAETKPLVELVAQRSAHLEEIFWLENKIKRNRCLSFSHAISRPRKTRFAS